LIKEKSIPPFSLKLELANFQLFFKDAIQSYTELNKNAINQRPICHHCHHFSFYHPRAYKSTLLIASTVIHLSTNLSFLSTCDDYQLALKMDYLFGNKLFT